MNEPETFVARWSRRKREAGKAAKEDAPETPSQPAAEVAPATGGEAAGGEGADKQSPAFDPASLPPIESITAGTDIRAFLQSGVPAELTKAALRRVWSTDPAIRDFIGIAENQWDFTDPTAIPGFGPLQAGDDVGKLVAQAMGKVGDTAEQLAGSAGGHEQAPRSGVHRNAAADETTSSAAAAQGVDASEENLGQPVPAAEADEEQSRVDVAVQDDPQPQKPTGPPNRRGHGSALPQ